MTSEPQVSWSGPLKSKKKNELQQICRQLAIDYKSDSLKADLEQQIRKRFKDNPSLQDDERFMKLDHNSTTTSPRANAPTSRRSIRGRSVSRPPRDLNDDEPSSIEDEPSPQNLPQSRKSSSTSVSTNPEQTINPEQTTAQKILVTLINPEQEQTHRSSSKSQSNLTEHPTQVSRLTKQASQQILESFNALLRHANCCTIAVIQAIQTTLSSSWNLCAIAILIELIFVVYSTMPLRSAIYVQPKQDGPWVGISEPVIRLINHIICKSFLRSFLEYLGLTVVVPIVIAGLMNVPSSKPQGENDKRKFNAKRDLKPSVFLCCATRLTVLALVHLVFYPNHRFGWPNQSIYITRPSPDVSDLNVEHHTISTLLPRNIPLVGLEYIQYITTTFAMAFALHQLLKPIRQSHLA